MENDWEVIKGYFDCDILLIIKNIFESKEKCFVMNLLNDFVSL